MTYYLIAKRDDNGLREMGSRALKALASALDHEYIFGDCYHITGALVALGSAAIPTLKAVLGGNTDNKNWEARESAARALGVIGHPSATPALLAALRDESPTVRREAAEALGKVGDESSCLRPLVELLSSSDPDEKLSVLLGIRGLARREGQRDRVTRALAFRELQETREHGNSKLCDLAAEVLGLWGEHGPGAGRSPA
jgi:hypothetical protein